MSNEGSPDNQSNTLHTSPDETGEWQSSSSEPPPPAKPSQPQFPDATFYRINPRGVSIKDALLELKPSNLLGYPLLKIFGSAFPMSSDDPTVESLDPFIVDREEIPGPLGEQINAYIRDLEADGFNFAACHEIVDVLHATTTVLWTFSHRTLPVVARLHLRHWTLVHPARIKLYLEMVTAYPDKTFLWSLSGSPDFTWPQSCHVVRQLNANARDLLQLHENTRANLAKPVSPRTARSRDEALDIANALHAEVRDFHLARKIFVPLTERDREQQSQLQQVFKDVRAQSPAHIPVILEMHRQLTRRPTWLSAFILLIISLGFFIAVGFRGETLLGVLVLVPILFIHELGHFVAMKVFGYNNVRMFFIPGFGAAVSGTHVNVPGWKRAIVALMGPIPSIALAIILGLVGIVLKHDWAIHGAIVALAINGFNLLPTLPLDGGHVAHITIFSRFLWLDIAFRVLAGIAIVALAAVLKLSVLMFFAVMMFIALPHAIRIAKVVSTTRSRQVRPQPNEDNAISIPVAIDIIDQLTALNKKPQPVRAMATTALQAYEAVNTRPPSLLASGSLLSLHVLGFLAALIFGAGFVLFTRDGGASFAAGRDNQTRYAVGEAPQRVSHALTSDSSSQPTHIIVATLSSPEDADKHLRELLAEAPKTASGSRFASTIFIRLPESDQPSIQPLLTKARVAAPNAFVQTAEFAAYFRLNALAKTPADAERLREEFNIATSSDAKSMLVPPWSSRRLTPDELIARETSSAFYDLSGRAWETPEVQAIGKDAGKAQRDGDAKRAKELRESQEVLRTKVRKRLFEELLTRPASEVNHDLLKRCEDLMQSDADDKFERIDAEFAKYVGTIPQDAPLPERVGTTGFATARSRVLSIRHMRFGDPAYGLEALVSWLEREGCTSIRYDFVGEEVYGDD